MLLQRMTKLLIRYHWMSFGIMTLAMFFVGQWTEEVAEWTSMELRPVINWHKFFGKKVTPLFVSTYQLYIISIPSLKLIWSFIPMM